MSVKILDRYIGITIINATLAVLLILLGLESFIEFVGQLQDIGTKAYGLTEALLYVPLLLPGDLYQLFPMAALLGALIGLGKLASGSELIVVRSAGISMAQITWVVVKTGIVMLLVMTFIGEWAAPNADHFAQRVKAIAISGGQALHTRHGTWVRDGDNFIHIDAVLADGELQGITRYKFNKQHRLLLASSANHGQLMDGKWLFNDVNESQIMQNQVVSQHFAQQQWDVKLNPHLLGLTKINPTQDTLVKLYHYIHFRKESGLRVAQYQFVFWQRLFQPLATLVMLCLAVPFVFGPLRTASMGLRIVAGVIVGFSFYILNEFFGPFSMVYQFPPILAAALPTLLFAVGGLFLLLSPSIYFRKQ